ncbi:hypothetical protein E2562_026896 [Oryza meyeriana var. granulata]|uniref:Uncharacterized protein n=1 Tax=Oryza meyeriana var. granulata TaxID=110450 RepID=A0A6G1EPK8_9ORYZ|nr:hypothetical protein E2562_026896 [Oryza meyeriana var. granulata]
MGYTPWDLVMRNSFSSSYMVSSSSPVPATANYGGGDLRGDNSLAARDDEEDGKEEMVMGVHGYGSPNYCRRGGSRQEGKGGGGSDQEDDGEEEARIKGWR